MREKIVFSKGTSLPINSTAILVLVVMFIALFFAIVTGVIGGKDSGLVGRLLGLEDDFSPESATGASFEDTGEEEVLRVSLESRGELERGVFT